MKFYFRFFFVVGIGYFLGKKNPKLDTTFIANFGANIGSPAIVFYSVTTTGLTFEIFVSYFLYYFLAIVGLLSTVIAAFYYLRIIKIMYFDEEKDSYDKDHNLWLKLSLTVSTILILMYFIFPSELIDVVSKINII